MVEFHFSEYGLSDKEVLESRQKHGTNQLSHKKTNRFFDVLKHLIKEPMVLILLIASTVYFISGKFDDGFFLLAAIILVALISLYQDSRSRNALEKLNYLTQPNCTVIRNGKRQEIKIEDLVIGDYLLVEEGTSIPADGTIVHSNDFSVNESVLTGESLSVYKDATGDDPIIYRGTTVAGGLAIAKITEIGNQTKLGKIGKSLEDISEEKTPLEIKINSFVKWMVIAGVVVFALVWLINFFNSHDALQSLLLALTLAMSILPEEIPVAFTTFMALGAWRLMKMGIVVKQMKTVETLGSATVICVDKTGTITENEMTLAKLFTLSSQKISDPENVQSDEEKELIEVAMWASEPIPFDPMEIAIHAAYKRELKIDERPNYKLIHEYPLSGKPPMMTHIFENKSGNRIIAVKGAVEAIIKVSTLSADEISQIEKIVSDFAKEGYRVLGIGLSDFSEKTFPKNQQDFKFAFKGLVAFYDPPKKNISEVLNNFYAAGIDVKIVTGDNAETTTAIAKQVGFRGYEKSISGEALMKLSDEELQEKVMDIQLFSRMFPEAKLKIINALKAKNQIVAMTGDGVNDGPALKAAHIGIAMGKRGTEIAKQAASLVLLEDDLSKMVDAVAMGRKIYTNLKKAIQYVISIHIPIILVVFIPLALGWIYPSIFSPVHVIFLELIMGPTCSIIYENEPMEKNTLLQKPRPFTATFFSWRELTTSVLQGLMITVGVLLIYRYSVYNDYSENLTRTMVFTALIAANIFLTLVNRSFYYSVLTTLRYKNKLVLLIIGITILITLLLVYVPILTNFFELEQLNLVQLSIACAIGFASVIWYEAVKWWKRKSAQ